MLARGAAQRARPGRMRRVLGLLLLTLMLALLSLGVWLRVRPAHHELATVSIASDARPQTLPTRPNQTEAPAPLVDAAPSAQRAPLAAEPPASTAARLAWLLLDAETSEPVPWYALDVAASDGTVARVTSAADGRFETSEALAPGKVSLRLVDAVGQIFSSQHPVSLVHREVRELHEVRIEVGPTYFVDAVLPDPLEPADLGARLFLDPPELDRSGDVPTTILRPPRGAETLWLRFAEPSSVQETPLWLELSSADGLWVGGARVPGGPGVHREPVHVELQPRCAVRGRLVTSAQEPGVGMLALFRAQDSGAPRWAGTDGDGRFRMDALEPGEYRLELRDEALRGPPVTFSLRAGELDLGELDCEPIPIAGSVHLRVQSDVELPIDVELVRRSDPPRSPPWHSDDWEPLPEGGFESAFDWDEVRAGTYEIAVHSHGLGEWHLALGELQPPVEDRVIRLPAPPPALELEVLDDESGAALSDWTVLVRGERAWEELDESPRSLALGLSGPNCAFAVCSPGHRAWIAVPGSTSWPRPDETRVTARLRRGWSHLFLARRRVRGDPVENVEIHLDGVLAGRTDAQGELWVFGGVLPEHLEVSHPTLVWANEDYVGLDELVTWIVLRP
jgi:hypothetical protein